MKKLLFCISMLFCLSSLAYAGNDVPLTYQPNGSIHEGNGKAPVGATLRIINDGTIDTCKPFETQIGVIVDIVYGKII